MGRSDAGSTKRPTAGRATYKSRDRKHPLRLTVTAEERDEIAKRAKAAGLSTASYLRAVALNKTIGSVLDHAAVGDLVRVAGDQGRLGGLLKLWLVDQPGKGAPEMEVRRLLDRIGEMQGVLADVVGRV
ncbi:MAG: plasmid mobilization protein [Janthinobacterium lividum]